MWGGIGLGGVLFRMNFDGMVGLFGGGGEEGGFF